MKSKGRPQRLLDKRPAVIKRWQRLRARKWAGLAVRAIMRWRLPWAERVRKRALVSAFETFKQQAIRHEKGKLPGLSTLFNFGLYLLIADRDIQALKIEALTHRDEWTRKLCARIILLTIYEWDADKVTGRQLKRAMDSMLIPAGLQQEAVECLRALRLIQRKANKQFSHVRNAAIAHRDPDALVQYRAIRDLQVNEVFALAAEFFQAVEKFVGVQTRLLTASNNLPALVNQWLAATSVADES